MKILIKQTRVVDPSSPFHNQIVDIFIENGIINRIAKKLDNEADKVIDQEDISVSPGWVDTFAHFCDPGFEFKETLETGSNAAAAGGYTDVMLLPNTRPVIDNKGQVEYIFRRTASFPVNLYPLGAITKNIEGKDLAEMYDMRSSGAIAFTDGINPLQSSGLLLKALQYVKAFGGIIIQIPDDKNIVPQGSMNEGIISTQLGLPGKPAMAEELFVTRDIELARYTGSALHFTGIASKKSIEYIKKAKEGGINITCSVTPYHLFFCDEDLWDYDSNLKVNPPLRTKEDRDALRKAVSDGTVDCIATHHLPHEMDSKMAEFENAKFGMIGLETCFAALKTVMPEITDEQWVKLLSMNPRKIFGLPSAGVHENANATLTIFDPGMKWEVKAEHFRSKSSNSPFIGKNLTGKAIGIINNDRVFLNY